MRGEGETFLFLSKEKARFRFGLLPVISLAAQAALIGGVGSLDDAEWLRRTLFPLSYIGLLAFVWVNRWSIAILIIGAGLLLNFVAIVANGGLMPVTPEALARSGLEDEARNTPLGDPLPHSKDVVLRKEDTRLWFLSDTLVIKNSSRLRAFSVGDVVIALGLVTGLCEAWHYYASRHKHSTVG